MLLFSGCFWKHDLLHEIWMQDLPDLLLSSLPALLTVSTLGSIDLYLGLCKKFGWWIGINLGVGEAKEFSWRREEGQILPRQLDLTVKQEYFLFIFRGQQKKGVDTQIEY